MPPKAKKPAAAEAGGTSMDPAAQLQQAGLVRSALEATNASLKARLAELGRESGTLRDTRAELARDAQDFLDYSTGQLRLKGDEIAALREAAAAAELARARERAALKAELAQLEADCKQAYEELEADSAAKIKERDALLARANEFLELRDQYESTMAEQAATIERERAASAEKIEDLERRLIVQRVEFERETEANFQAMKAKARAEVLHEQDEETRRVFSENRRIEAENAILAVECKSLSEERAELAETGRATRRDLELLQAAEKEWAVGSAGKERQLRELGARAAELEELLKGERRDRVAEYGGLMRAVERETEDMRLELAGLRSLTALKNRELRTVKRLAQIVLSQRTEVEQFFLDALTQVKIEVAKKKAAAIEAARAVADPALLVSSAPSSMLGGSGGGGAYGRYASAADSMQPSVISTRSGPGGSQQSLRGAASPAGAAAAHGGAARGAGGVMQGAGAGPSTLVLQLSVPSDAAAMPAGSITLPALAAASRRVPGKPAPASGGLPSPSSILQSPPRLAADGVGAGAGLPSAAAVDARVDITELSPEDRERVLRLLFAKINNMDLRAATQQQQQQQQPAAAALASESKVAERNPPPEQQRADEDVDAFAVGGPFGLAAGVPGDVQYRIRRDGAAAAAAADEIDASDLAAALGASAQERIAFAQQQQGAR
jgi:hypothetical protein